MFRSSKFSEETPVLARASPRFPVTQRAETDEARTPHQEAAEAQQAAVAMAGRLRRASPKTGERRSLRKISDELKDAGYFNERGRPYKACVVHA
jgi:hypothetical protein